MVYSLPTKCHRHQQSTRRLLSQQQYMYNLKDNVLHARKVEGLHSQLRTILNVNSQMDFISVVVLYAQHQAQIAPVLTLLGAPTILLEQVDQLVQHCVVERLYVLYYEEDGALLHALLLQDLLDTLESLFWEQVLVRGEGAEGLLVFFELLQMRVLWHLMWPCGSLLSCGSLGHGLARLLTWGQGYRLTKLNLLFEILHKLIYLRAADHDLRLLLLMSLWLDLGWHTETRLLQTTDELTANASLLICHLNIFVSSKFVALLLIRRADPILLVWAALTLTILANWYFQFDIFATIVLVVPLDARVLVESNACLHIQGLSKQHLYVLNRVF